MNIPTNRVIADTVAFLAGPDGGWINGQVLRANGGINLTVVVIARSTSSPHRNGTAAPWDRGLC